MKCKSCNLTFTVEKMHIHRVKLCPFCGDSFQVIPKNETLGSLMSRIRYEFGIEIFEDKRKLLGLFYDLAPQMTKEKALLEKLLCSINLVYVFNNRDDSLTVQEAVKKSVNKLENEHWLNKHAIDIVENAIYEFCEYSNIAKQGSTTSTDGTEEKEIYIDNTIIRDAIIQKLNKSEDNPKSTFLLSELNGIKDLKISNCNLTNIDEIKYLQNLEVLDLSKNQINNIEIIGDMHLLTNLNLNGNQITDASCLSNLHLLERLNLSGNNIEEITFLEKLDNVTHLNMNGNQISDIDILKSMKQLVELEMAYNNIDDIGILKRLTNLYELNVSRNKIGNVSCLRNLEYLTYMNLSTNNINDISDLYDLKNLMYLNLYGNPIDDRHMIKHLEQHIRHFYI